MSKRRIQTIYFSIYNFEMLLRSNRKYSLFHLRFRNAFKDESKISLFPFTISKCLKKTNPNYLFFHLLFRNAFEKES